MSSKTCRHCGTSFSRIHGESAARWAERSFCSRKCSAVRLQTERQASRPPAKPSVAKACDQLHRACWAIFEREARARQLNSPFEAAVMMGMAA